MQGCRFARLIGYDGGMKPFQFSLRTLFIVVTLISVPLGWTMCQLKWLHDRHAFMATKMRAIDWVDTSRRIPVPWQLAIFGEKPVTDATWEVDTSDLTEAEHLFPEASYLIVPRKHPISD